MIFIVLILSPVAVQSTPWRDAGDLSSKEITSKLVDTLAYMNGKPNHRRYHHHYTIQYHHHHHSITITITLTVIMFTFTSSYHSSPGVCSDDVGEIKSLSLWLVVDLTGETGLNLLKEAVEYLVRIKSGN